MRDRICAMGLAAATLTLAPFAAAQPSPTSGPSVSTNAPAAEALYNEGRKLLDAGRYAEACAKLEESQRLDPGMGTQFYLGECYEKQGRIATAWQLFREIEGAARAAGRADRLDVAKKRADALEPRVPKLVLEVPWGEKLPGTAVLRVDAAQQVPVGHAQWSMAVPVDPGHYTIRVTAPGKKPLEAVVDVPEGKTTTFALPEPADLPPAPASGDAPPPNRGSTLRTAGWITGAVGLGTVAAGVIVGLVGVARYGDSSSECDANDLCSQKGLDIRAEGKTLADVGTVLFFVGAAGVVGGVTMVLLAPKAPPTRAAVVPVIGPLSFGVRGTF